jgi:hypothetical protein
MQKRAVALHFCREKRPAGKRQDVVYIHEWYYSRGKRILQDLHCINISVFLPEELVILRNPLPAPAVFAAHLPGGGVWFLYFSSRGTAAPDMMQGVPTISSATTSCQWVLCADRRLYRAL